MIIRYLSLSLLLTVCAFTLNAQTIEEKIAECEKYWDPEVLKRANTAKDADYLSEISKQSIYFANLARFDGPLFAKTFMATMCSDWETNTSENFKTLKEDLAKSVGLFPLRPDPGLTAAAQSHAEDDKKNAHTSGDGTGCTQRVAVKFKCRNYGAENIAWGRYTNGLQPIIQWLIDNGNAPHYGHRRHILGPGYTNLGVGLSCNPSDGGCCMVQDFGRYRDEEVLDYIYKNFPERLIKLADVARNVDYMNEKEKDLIMIANVARLDLRLFNQKVMKELNPEPDTAIIHYIESKYDVPMCLLYPDRRVQNFAYERVSSDDFVPFEPVLTDTQDKRWSWRQSYGWNCTLWTILFSRALYDEVNYSVGYKFAYSPTKGYAFTQYVWHTKSDEGWDYKLTSELYQPSNNDKPNPNSFPVNDSVEPIVPVEPPSNGNKVRPILDAVYEEGTAVPAEEDEEYNDDDDDYYDDDDDDEEYDDDDDEYDDDDEEYDDEDEEDDEYHHHPGHHPSHHHHHHHHYNHY